MLPRAKITCDDCLNITGNYQIFKTRPGNHGGNLEKVILGSIEARLVDEDNLGDEIHFLGYYLCPVMEDPVQCKEDVKEWWGPIGTIFVHKTCIFL